MSPRQLRAVWEAGLGLPMDVWSTKSKSRVIMRERRILAARGGTNPSPFKCQSLSSLSQEPPACWGSRRTSKLLHPCLGCLLQQRTAWQRWTSDVLLRAFPR